MSASPTFFAVIDMAKVIIDVNKKYAEYLKEHLQREHPKTRGRIKVKK